MADFNSTCGRSLRVPRFVQSLNQLAEEAGFSTKVAIEPLWDDNEPLVVSTWWGPREAFLKLRFLSPTLQSKVHTKGGIIGWPTRYEARHPVLYGELHVEQSGVELKLSSGAVPRRIRTEGAIEITEYADEVAYHGTKEDLIAVGICTASHFPNKNTVKSHVSYRDVDRHWLTRRYPDDRYVHWVETVKAYTKRKKEEEAEERTRRCGQGQDRAEEAALSGTIDEHRGKLLRYVSSLGEMVQGHLNDEKGFYRLSATDQQKLSEAWTHVRSIIHNATIRPRRFAVIEGGRALAKPESTL